MLNIAIKNAPKLFDLFFLYETVDVFGIHDLQFWNMFINITIRSVCFTDESSGVYWVSIRCALGEH